MGLGFGRSQLACHTFSEPQFPFLDEMKYFEVAEGSHPAQRGSPPSARSKAAAQLLREAPAPPAGVRWDDSPGPGRLRCLWRWLPGGWAAPPGLEPQAGTETSGWQESQTHKGTDTFQAHPKTWAQYHPRPSHCSRSTEKQGAEDGRRCAQSLDTWTTVGTRMCVPEALHGV